MTDLKEAWFIFREAFTRFIPRWLYMRPFRGPRLFQTHMPMMLMACARPPGVLRAESVIEYCAAVCEAAPERFPGSRGLSQIRFFCVGIFSDSLKCLGRRGRPGKNRLHRRALARRVFHSTGPRTHARRPRFFECNAARASAEYCCGILRRLEASLQKPPTDRQPPGCTAKTERGAFDPHGPLPDADARGGASF